MFMAGYVPGILMAVSMMIVVAIVSKKRGYKPSREKAATFGEIMTQFKESIWALLFPFGIIAGLRMGMFTPSEAGAVAVVYCILVGVFIYKELKWEYAWPIMKETIYGTSSCCTDYRSSFFLWLLSELGAYSAAYHFCNA